MSCMSCDNQILLVRRKGRSVIGDDYDIVKKAIRGAIVKHSDANGRWAREALTKDDLLEGVSKEIIETLMSEFYYSTRALVLNPQKP